MHKLEIKLKQHTPLIHFQHDQEGATLRASEVKPKLDRFIINRLKETDEYNQGVQEGWIKRKNDKEWLDYKMRLIVSNVHNAALERNNELPMYFGNMNSDNPKGKSECIGNSLLQLTIISNNNDLLTIISKHITDFFLLNNFGTRQSKGYGSFSVKAINDKPVGKEVPNTYAACFYTTKGKRRSMH